MGVPLMLQEVVTGAPPMCRFQDITYTRPTPLPDVCVSGTEDASAAVLPEN
jgi:hypothetical protein